MKLGIIGGGGQLGGTTAFQVAMRGLVDEIILFDARENVAKSHAMDIEQAKSEYSDTKIRVGELDELRECEIVLNAAGLPSKADSNVASRDHALARNAGLARELGKQIGAWGTNPVLISVTNPADVINYMIFEGAGLAPERCLALSRNDTSRFKWAIELRTGISARTFDALVIGEHGDLQVPLFSTVRSLETGEPLVFSSEDKAWIMNRILTWLPEYQSLRASRSSPWVSSANLARIIGLVISGGDDLCPCSVIPSGEYGLSGLSIGLPVRLGPGGVREIVELELADEEREGLMKAAEKISGTIQRER